MKFHIVNIKHVTNITMVNTMFDTAIALKNNADVIDNKPSETQLLSAWLFDQDEKISAGCLLVDISDGGAAILIPVNQPVPTEAFDLVIMSSEDRHEILTILEAEKRWLDTGYSTTHKKMGVEFLHLDTIKLQVISSLIQLMETRKNSSIDCDVVNI